MTTKFDARQTISRDTLTRITGAANSQADDIFRALDSEITPPLALTATGANRVVTIGNITVTNPDTSLNRTIPPISNLIPSFTTATVTLSATGAGTATATGGSTVNLGMTASQFLRIGISLTATGVITLTSGTAAASLAAATIPPTVSGLFAIGHVVVRTDGSNNVANVLKGDLYQYVGGGGGSGTGNGNTILETLKNEFVDSPYQLLTPNVIITDGSTKFASITGATYDLVSNTIKFTANAQVATSIQMLDATEFLPVALDVGSIDLSVFWSRGSALTTLNIPPAFTYEVSRDGGTNWFTVAMTQIGSTDTFRGPLRFDTTTTTESVKQTILTQTTQDANRVLNATTQQRVGQAFTLTTTTKIQEVAIQIAKAGSPSGTLTVSIVANNAGVPSLVASDVLSASNPIAISSIAAGPALVTVTMPAITLAAGTYHVLLSTDAAYKSSFVSTTTELRLRERQTGGSAPFTTVYNGTTYSTGSPSGNLTYTINGRALDLRVRITSAGSPTYPAGLDGFGIFYNLQDVGIVGAVRKTQRFAFNSVIDNSNSFTISSFSPDPDLLTCWYIEAGQGFKVPAFSLSGNVVTFPVNSFNNGGISSTVTLVFEQNSGGAYDNSDVNARLLATNHLGSTSGTDDKSSAGRGIILRNAAGTLVEVSVNALNQLIITSVP